MENNFDDGKRSDLGVETIKKVQKEVAGKNDPKLVKAVQRAEISKRGLIDKGHRNRAIPRNYMKRHP